MARRPTSILGRRYPACRLALGHLLLLLISYGVTVEVTQSHGFFVSASREHAVQTGDAGNPQSSKGPRSHQTECSMCQFQQHLSSSLICTPSLLLSSPIRFEFVSAQTELHPSTATIPTSDRAPPQS
jgi:hypothetical protein